MAGEIEDCISNQADSLPTGSISFGRFETEPLSWERRSSFAHNRYLEEVEKYSTPGSVTQKKAYFEAHFRKKALLLQASSGTHYGAECQNNENRDEDWMKYMEESQEGHVNYVEESVDCGDDRQNQFAWYGEIQSVSGEHEVIECEQEDAGQNQFAWYDETQPVSDEYEIIKCEQADAGQNQFAWYDEMPAVSNEYEVKECEQEELTSPPEFPTVTNPSNDGEVLDLAPDQPGHDETVQTQNGNDTCRSNKGNLHVFLEQKLENDRPKITVDQKPENETRITEHVLEKISISSKSPTFEKRDTSNLRKTQSVSYMGPINQKPAKANLKNQLPVVPVSRTPASEKNSLSSVKMPSKTLGKVEREKTQRAQTEKQSPSRISRIASEPKSKRSEDSENLKAKVRLENRRQNSGIGRAGKKGGAIPVSTSGKSEIDVQHSVNRPTWVVNSGKADVKQCSAGFSFKSEERAEKRKEFYMKLEEKQHAKEAEMNQIHARTQEEREAEIKQLRKSLNFKATPMPSFYQEAVPSASDGKKSAATPAKSSRSWSKSTSPAGKTSTREKSPAASKVANKEGPSSGEPKSFPQVDCPNTAEANDGCATQANGINKTCEHQAQPARKTEAGKKEERGKPSVRQDQGDNTGKKGERVGTIKRGTVGKAMKSLVGGSVAVDVAS